jgi:hypothetical protein
MAAKKTTSEDSPIPAESHAAEQSQETTNGVQSELQALAYELWLDRGSPLGSPEIDWFEAEARIRAELHASTSTRRRQAYRAAAGVTNKP